MMACNGIQRRGRQIEEYIDDYRHVVVLFNGLSRIFSNKLEIRNSMVEQFSCRKNKLHYMVRTIVLSFDVFCSMFEVLRM